MASFYGNEIIFDGVSSLNYDLRISSFETGGTSKGNAGSESQLIQKYINKRTSPYYYGRTNHTPLEFAVTLTNFDSKFSAIDRSLVEQWLLGRSTYKDFIIVQDDMQTIIFSVIIDKASIEYVGNIARGITLNVKCREPWGYESAKKITRTYGGGGTVSDAFDIYNSSDVDDYVYPYVVFTTNALPSSVQIFNASEGNRAIVFSTVYANQTFRIDCDRQILYNTLSDLSSMNMMPYFNKTFLRLIPGKNTIGVLGSLANLTINYRFAKKIGG